jgi:starvation-inducible DNA-binding protein
MEELVIATRVALANTFMMYFKAHSHHWNVVGTDFAQHHEFFGDLYEEVFGAVDSISEQLRQLKVKSPKTLSELYQYKTVNEGNVAETTPEMFQDLLIANAGVLESLNKAMELAESHREMGLANHMQDRIEAHKKHEWMIRSHLQ